MECISNQDTYADRLYEKKNAAGKLEQLLASLPVEVRQVIMQFKPDYDKMTEIRMRLGKRLLLYQDNTEYSLNLVIHAGHMNELLEFATRHSAYAYENELRQGFLTVRGGHRIGFCGKAVVKNGQVTGFKHISSVNIRVAHEIKGCAAAIMPYIIGAGVRERADSRRTVCAMGSPGGVYAQNTLIISPPGCGKTTILRDIVRELSNLCNVGVCDERGEIAACFEGIAANDIGSHSDVIEGCDKASAVEFLLRTMTPKVIAIDEIGRQDVANLNKICNSGCCVMATIHGNDLRQIMEREDFVPAIRAFDRIIVLSLSAGVGTVEAIYASEASIKAWDGEKIIEDSNACDNGFVLLYDRTEFLQ